MSESLVAYLASLSGDPGQTTPTLPAMRARPPRRSRQVFRVNAPPSQNVEDRRPGAPRAPAKPPTDPGKRSAVSEMEDRKAEMDMDQAERFHERYGSVSNWPNKVPGAAHPHPAGQLLPAAMAEATRIGIARLRLAAVRRKARVGDGFDEQDQMDAPADGAGWPRDPRPHSARGT
jgi:hypothetical protein